MDLDLIAELLKPFLAPITNDTGNLLRGYPDPAVSRYHQMSATLSNEQLTSISTYIDLLVRWNSRINLTAIRDPQQIVIRHFGESLFAARHLFPVDPPESKFLEATPAASASTAGVEPGRTRAEKAPGRPTQPTEASINPTHLLDIGSGPGFPALPIKIWAPQIRLTLVESNQKKATFLREVSRAITLTNVDVINSRAEDLPAAAAETVTLRAVERFETILPIAARLARPEGRLALLIGESQLKSVKAEANIKWNHPVLIPQSNSRILLIGECERRPAPRE
jgi:16S rRNA (guanine527-N7)-methyltransferase